MNRQERSKQFMPFAALRGYYDIVRQQEEIKEPKKELSEYEAQKISDKLNKIKKGMIVDVKYYDKDAYKNINGYVANFDETFKNMTIVKTKINFDDILFIEIKEK